MRMEKARATIVQSQSFMKSLQEQAYREPNRKLIKKKGQLQLACPLFLSYNEIYII